jgi:hypothetical protein
LNAFHALRLATTRVDSIRYTMGVVELSWPSPANANDRKPYRVEWKPALAAAWTALTNQNAFRYDHQRTYWTDDGTETGGASSTRLYRIGLRPL